MTSAAMVQAAKRREPEGPDADKARQDVARLVTLVNDCMKAGIPREACLVRLSALPEERVKPLHLRLARSALEPITQADRAQLFQLPNGDMAAIWRGPAEAAANASRTTIEHMFTDDKAPAPTARLWEAFTLPADGDRLLAALSALAHPRKESPPAEPSPNALAQLDAQALTAIETALARADVSHFARRRDICMRMPDASFRRRWEKRYLSVEDITQSLAPGHATRLEPWLFRRLTRTLDRRMLALLAANGELRDAGPFAINLNVASVLAPEFLRLDESLPATLRGHVIIDLSPADVMADPSAFVFARDFAHSRGYRLQLRNITAELLPVFDLHRLGVDIMELHWSDAVASIGPEVILPNASSVVLSHANTPDAIIWGLAHGVTLYRGEMAIPERSRTGRTGQSLILH
jgi:hypothetical protein